MSNNQFKFDMSFYDWCIDNNRQDLLDRWDYELNKEVNPYSVNLRDKRKFWWKCREEEHSYEATISHRIFNEACVYCSNSKLLIGFNDVRTKKEYVIDANGNATKYSYNA